MTGKKSYKGEFETGSALILAVVLVSLLAVIGVMFVMAARLDEMATSSISENKELSFAVESVVAKISEQLILDVPGVNTTNIDYYDYPGDYDRWLANLEPYSEGAYRWRQISDVTGYIDRNWGQMAQQDVTVDIVKENEPIRLDGDGEIQGPGGQLADADGDGAADSKWVKLDDITSSKGKPIFAAIRVVDNGAMLNVNTAYEFDPNGVTDPNKIDGSSLLQINLMALAGRPNYTISEETELLQERANYPYSGVDYDDLDKYEEDVVWRYKAADSNYTPFDISDELEMRYRFLLNHTDIDTRLEGWGGEFRKYTSSTPFHDLSEWYQSAYDEGDLDPNYAYRHIATTYNMDRIMDPNGGRMVNVNTASAELIRDVIGKALLNTDPCEPDPNFADANGAAAQLAANIIDFRDNDSNVTVVSDGSGNPHYGFERPCIYISELAHNFVEPNVPSGSLTSVYRSYAIELYKPYEEDIYPPDDEWQLQIVGGLSTISVDIDWSGTKHFHVIRWENPDALIDVNFDPGDSDPNFIASVLDIAYDGLSVIFSSGRQVQLLRLVAGTGDYVVVDSVEVPFADGNWLARDVGPQSVERDINRHKCIRKLWQTGAMADFPTLGQANTYFSSDPNVIQAHPENTRFRNIGEIAKIFSKNAYAIEASDTESDVRFDLTDPAYQRVFRYLTRFDPTADNIDNDGDGDIDESDYSEWKVPGRLNINTAPWYAMAQLPWMEPEIARAIIAYRDKTVITDQSSVNYADRQSATGLDYLRQEPGFASIGEVAAVLNDSGADDYSMHHFALPPETGDLIDFPDLTHTDGAPDDFEERDVIFARISDLATVRSDVFTAYILVRIGADGPQKRVVAILDRSDVYAGDDKVKVRVLHPVADPR